MLRINEIRSCICI